MILFSTPTCPQCERLKAALKLAGKDYDERDLLDPKNLSELRCMGIFALQAPVLVFSEEPLKYLEAGHIAAQSDETLYDLVR